MYTNFSKVMDWCDEVFERVEVCQKGEGPEVVGQVESVLNVLEIRVDHFVKEHWVKQGRVDREEKEYLNTVLELLLWMNRYMGNGEKLCDAGGRRKNVVYKTWLELRGYLIGLDEETRELGDIVMIYDGFMEEIS